jgi:hypothetical protein
MILNVFATYELGRNELHIALAPWVVAKFERIKYLIYAGVPLNARDHGGKTPLAYWCEPREFEIHWFRVWLFERLSGDPEFRRQQDDCANISARLERSGAQLWVRVVGSRAANSLPTAPAIAQFPLPAAKQAFPEKVCQENVKSVMLCER